MSLRSPNSQFAFLATQTLNRASSLVQTSLDPLLWLMWPSTWAVTWIGRCHIGNHPFLRLLLRCFPSQKYFFPPFSRILGSPFRHSLERRFGDRLLVPSNASPKFLFPTVNPLPESASLQLVPDSIRLAVDLQVVRAVLGAYEQRRRHGACKQRRHGCDAACLQAATNRPRPCSVPRPTSGQFCSCCPRFPTTL